MENYVVNKSPQALRQKYQVHNFTAGCGHLPHAANTLHLGEFENINDASEEARRLLGEAEACFYCCNDALLASLKKVRDEWGRRRTV